MRPILLSFATSLLFAAPALATPGDNGIEPAPLMNITVDGFADAAPIPMKYALCEATPDGKSTEGENLRPAISWSGAPAETKSYVVIMKDPDVPADFTDAGKEGKTVAADAKRQLFYHWALADIPASKTGIPGGPADKAPGFGTKASGSLGKYVPDATQYGGPCPPWNDARVHHYFFTVHALDVATLPLPTNPTARDVEMAVADHSIAHGTAEGTYTLNRALMQ